MNHEPDSPAPVGDAGGINHQINKRYLVLIVSVATIGGFLFGFDTMIFSGAQLFLQTQFELSASQLGFSGACVILGALAGTLLASGIGDAIGRKKTMIFAGVLFAFSAIGTAIPETIVMFNIFRVIGGIGIGLAMVISPVYIAEVAPRRIRGALVTLNQIVIVGGALIALILSYFLAKHVSDDISWRWMFGSECVPILGLVLGLLLIPESPRWLVKMGRESEARDVLARINGPEAAELDVREINASIVLEKQPQAAGYAELFHPGIRVAMFIGIGLAVFQQISGGMPLAMYAPLIFKQAGFVKTEDAIGLTIFIFLWSMACVFIVLWAVERFGRRPMLMFGMSGMVLGHLVMAASFHLGWTGPVVPIVLSLTIGMSNLSISPLAWVVLAEIYPTNIRGRAMGIATFALYLFMYLMNWLFPPVKEYFEENFGTPAGIFVVLACICVACVLFIFKWVPETKGKSLEEISNFWIRKQR